MLLNRLYMFLIFTTVLGADAVEFNSKESLHSIEFKKAYLRRENLSDIRYKASSYKNDYKTEIRYSDYVRSKSDITQDKRENLIKDRILKNSLRNIKHNDYNLCKLDLNR